MALANVNDWRLAMSQILTSDHFTNGALTSQNWTKFGISDADRTAILGHYNNFVASGTNQPNYTAPTVKPAIGE